MSFGLPFLLTFAALCGPITSLELSFPLPFSILAVSSPSISAAAAAAIMDAWRAAAYLLGGYGYGRQVLKPPPRYPTTWFGSL